MPEPDEVVSGWESAGRWLGGGTDSDADPGNRGETHRLKLLRQHRLQVTRQTPRIMKRAPGIDFDHPRRRGNGTRFDAVRLIHKGSGQSGQSLTTDH